MTLNVKPKEKLAILDETKNLIKTSRKALGTIGTLDGIVYYFIYKEEDKIHIAFKNPSDVDSPVTMLIKKINALVSKKKTI